MEQNLTHRQRTNQTVLLAVLTAIVLVLQIVSDFWKIPFIMGTSLSLVLIPIVVGAILLGPRAGAWLGFVMGVEIYVHLGVMGADFFTAFLFQEHPLITAGICLIKSTLGGFLAGVIYRVVSKKYPLPAVFLAAAIVPIVNTGVFIGGCFVILSTIKNLMSAADIKQSAVYFLFIGCAGFNFIFELLLNLIMVPAIERIIHAFRSKRR